MSSYRPSDDFDSFIDFNGGFDQNSFADENQTYSGPSHQYDDYNQTTGLPTGAMANVSAYSDMNIDTDFTSPADFNRPISNTSGYNASGFDMEFDQTQQSASYPDFYSQPSTSNTSNFINPNAVYEQSRPVRMYPGMHTQQAEQAKAAAMAKHQTQHVAAPQMMQRNISERYHSTGKGKARAGSTSATDAVADRRISQILDNMRHKSGMSPIDENGSDSSAEAAAKAKREEEEMDEDERLLASEEGKKLSSKERRQLRNKVSARAFRSRRKEYIGQLEGDLAEKANEANDLRLFNRKLLDENNQLKNLTRTLLSHPAFQTFLEDMSRNQTFLAGPAPTHMQMPAPVETLPSQPQNEIKQEPEQYSQQQQQQTDHMQVNMAQIPDSSLDMSMLNLGKTHWGQQTNGFQFQQPSVFAVFELPRGPSIEEMRRSRLPPAHDVEDVEDGVTDCPERQEQRTSSGRNVISAPAPAFDYSFASLNRQLERSLVKARSPAGSQNMNLFGSSAGRTSISCTFIPSTARQGTLHAMSLRQMVR